MQVVLQTFFRKSAIAIPLHSRSADDELKRKTIGPPYTLPRPLQILLFYPADQTIQNSTAPLQILW